MNLVIKPKFLLRLFLCIFFTLSFYSNVKGMPLKNEEVKQWLSEWIALFDENITYNLNVSGIKGKIDVEKTICMLRNTHQISLCNPIIGNQDKIVGFSMVGIDILSKNIKKIELLDWLANKSNKKIKFKNECIGVSINIEDRDNSHFFNTRFSDFIFRNKYLDGSDEQDLSNEYIFLSEVCHSGSLPTTRNWSIQKITRRGAETTLSSIQV